MAMHDQPLSLEKLHEQRKLGKVIRKPLDGR